MKPEDFYPHPEDLIEPSLSGLFKEDISRAEEVKFAYGSGTRHGLFWGVVSTHIAWCLFLLVVRWLRHSHGW